MTDLHEALKDLSPVDWEEVPKDEINGYVSDLLKSSEIICNSVPATPEGTPFESSSIQNAPSIQPSDARAPTPHEQHEALQSLWGKSQKFSVKDNPHKVAVFKMAGRDRHGAWFARRSVHEGLGFNKFRTAMLREFPESLAVEGGPGAGAVRGIGADRRVERLENEGSTVEVYQLSAQFPGPTTPRDFLTMLVCCDGHSSWPNTRQGRQLMVISRPVAHPEAPERQGYIRGQYESVELIRELPLSDSAESNPVEWIMITRSDPGGGIPRFMVDRGTPSAMLVDLGKFLDWAVKIDESKEPAVSVDENEKSTESQTATKSPALVVEPPASPGQEAAHETGVFHQLTTALEASLDAYAPAMVSSFVHERLHARPSTDYSSDSSVSSGGSFASATERRTDSASIFSTGDKHHDKEMQKIQDAKLRLEERLTKKREEEDERLKKSQSDEQSESDKALERHTKETQKQEERHRKEMEKLEAKREREVKKFEEKKKKQADRDVVQKLTRERDDFRAQVDLLKRENALLRERIDSLDPPAA